VKLSGVPQVMGAGVDHTIFSFSELATGAGALGAGAFSATLLVRFLKLNPGFLSGVAGNPHTERAIWRMSRDVGESAVADEEAWLCIWRAAE
jgi:hypothetical protein